MGMGMTLSLSPSLIQRVAILSLNAVFGESSGDIPLYSLHRIRFLLRKRPISVSLHITKLFLDSVIHANVQYKKETKKNWNCLTGNYFVFAIKHLDQLLEDMINSSADAANASDLQARVVATLHEQRAENIKVIKQWFSENHDELLYIMGKKIPWAVVQHLRASLNLWVLGRGNPFEEAVEDMVLDVARSQGINTDNAEEAWELMGGQLSKEQN